jgi:hypothetical protein
MSYGANDANGVKIRDVIHGAKIHDENRHVTHGASDGNHGYHCASSYASSFPTFP